MTFTTTNLASGSVLVEGTDNRGVAGQMVVDGAEWAHLNERDRIAEAHEAFDAKVEEFFSELTEAAAELEAAHQEPGYDPLTVVVVQEEVEGYAGQAAIVRTLQPGTVILRAIAEGASDRLIWVNGTLVLTAAPVEPATEDSEETEVEGDQPVA